MGNQIPESHNQSLETTETETIVESLISDLVKAVDIKESIMSEAQTSDCEDLDQTTYFETNESHPNHPLDSTVIFLNNQILAPKTSDDFMELEMNADEETDYSSKRSGSSSPISDWKYSSYASPNSTSNNDNSKTYQNVGSKYNDIFDSIRSNLNKEDNHLNKRSSIMQNFDPLFGTQSTSPSPPERRKARHRIDKHFYIDQHNDSTGLIDDFSRFKITETPKLETHPLIRPISEPKPDVLVSAVQQQKENELKDRIKELEDQLKEKDVKLEDLMQELQTSKESEGKLLQLNQVFHQINSELVIITTNQLDSSERERMAAINQKNEMERHCEQLRDELTAIKETKVNAVNENCYKVQIKRMDMKLKSLELQLEQKSKENAELSAMVDELIGGVRN